MARLACPAVFVTGATFKAREAGLVGAGLNPQSTHKLRPDPVRTPLEGGTRAPRNPRSSIVNRESGIQPSPSSDGRSRLQFLSILSSPLLNSPEPEILAHCVANVVRGHSRKFRE